MNYLHIRKLHICFQRVLLLVIMPRSVSKIIEKKKKFCYLVSMEMAGILDLMGLAKVHM